MQRLIAEGAVGEVISARSWHCAPPMGDFYPEGAWRLSAGSAGGGVAVDTGSHWFRPLRMWLGEVTEVLAVTGHPFAAMEGESMCRSLCRFDSGVVASFDVTLTPGAAALGALLPGHRHEGRAGRRGPGRGRALGRHHPAPS